MIRSFSKKTPFLFLAALYFTALILGTLCSFDPPAGQSHHHGRTVSHTASCLLACASTISDRPQTLPLTLSLVLIGILLAFGRPLAYQSTPLRLHGRSPPL